MRIFSKIIIIIFIAYIQSLYTADTKECKKFKSESDCKYNESNNCSWVSGEERCISREKFRKKYRDNRPYYRDNWERKEKKRRKKRDIDEE